MDLQPQTNSEPEQAERASASNDAATPEPARQPEDARATAAAARDALVPLLGRVERGERNALEDFRRAICELVAKLRADGVPHAQVIEIVSGLAGTASSPEGRYALTAAAREALVQLSLEWCAEEYGKTDGPGEARSAGSEHGKANGPEHGNAEGTEA